MAYFLETGKKSGEPYELAGKRIVFTNWYYVRPGSFGWYNKSGKNVTVYGSGGPWEASIRHTDWPHGVRLVAQPAERRTVLSKNLGQVIQDGKTYRAWTEKLYTESKDGIAWEREEPMEFNPPKLARMFGHGTVFIDPSAPPSERYKWVGTDEFGETSREEFEEYRKRRPENWEPRADRVDVNLILAVRGAVSPDGIHWTMLPEPLVVEHCDTVATAYYDERLHKYVLYTRNWMVGPRSERAPDDRGLSWMRIGRRSIGRSESRDFSIFPLSEIIIEPGPDMLPSDVFYTNCKTTVPGAPDHHLMFPTVWHTSDDTTSIHLASSHDGRLWHFLRTPSGLAVAKTAPFGQWDGGCLFAEGNLVELPDGSWVLPYRASPAPHKYPRGSVGKSETGWPSSVPGWRCLVWPKGRLVAIEAPERGEFATVAIVILGRKIRINALTQRAGSILVEVADTSGKTLPNRSFGDADPVVGDQYKTLLTWNGQDDLCHENDGGIILRFRMEMAKIFGLEFE